MKKGRSKELIFDTLNLDSLMDILTCIVALVFLIVVLGVFQGKGTVIFKKLPRQHIAQQSSSEKEEKKILIIYCQNNELSLAVPNLFEKLFGKHPHVSTYSDLKYIVDKANLKKIENTFYSYRVIILQSWFSYYPYLLIDKKNDTCFINLKEIDKNPKKFIALLKPYENNAYWVNFMVDSASIYLFRKARDICASLNYNTGWYITNIKKRSCDTISLSSTGSSYAGPDLKPLN